MRKLERKLLGVGGERVALRPDHFARAIVQDGQTFAGAGAALVRGEVSGCHQNVARLWIKRRRKGFAIVAGWALSDDGCWRQHTWGLEEGGVVETTLERTAYFGVVLDVAQSAKFCFDNAAADLDAAWPKLMKNDPAFRAVILALAEDADSITIRRTPS